jgi:hypothetical protein
MRTKPITYRDSPLAEPIGISAGIPRRIGARLLPMWWQPLCQCGVINARPGGLTVARCRTTRRSSTTRRTAIKYPRARHTRCLNSPRVPSLDAFGRRPRCLPRCRNGPSSETLHKLRKTGTTAALPVNLQQRKCLPTGHYSAVCRRWYHRRAQGGGALGYVGGLINAHVFGLCVAEHAAGPTSSQSGCFEMKASLFCTARYIGSVSHDLWPLSGEYCSGDARRVDAVAATRFLLLGFLDFCKTTY